MELKYLRTFKTILETGSFQKAAERLNYAQSTVTLQMQIIEQELSVKLFDKIGRKMELTEAGKELLPYIDTALEAVEQMECYGKSGKELTGTLRIAMPESLLVYQMQPVIKAFREQAPNVRLSLQIPNCYIIRDQLLNGSIDVGVHYDVGGYGSSLITEPLAGYPLALIASPALDEKKRDFVRRGQRKSICLITVDQNSVYHKILNAYLDKSDIVLEGEMEIESIEAAKRCVSSNLGVAFLPRYSVERELEQGKLIELPLGSSVKNITAVCSYHKNKWITPAMELFIRLLRGEMQGPEA